MNKVGDYGGGPSGGRKIGPRPQKGKDQRDEDLVLFREMFKQERTISLLQPESVEFEPNGNYQFYRHTSGRKGCEFLPDSGKSDYDWLKTPPATPLFASLEMDYSIKPEELVVQCEIPILQPLSRFSRNPIPPPEKPTSSAKYKSPKPKPIPEDLLVVPNVNLRPIKTTFTPAEPKPRTTKFKNPTTSITQKTTINKKTITTSTTTKVTAKPTNQPQPPRTKQESPNPNFLAWNLSKSMQEQKTLKTINILGISDETPSNLLKTRDKSVNRTRTSRTETTHLRRETNNSKTSTRSASVSSFRCLEQKQETNKMQTQVLGSRMVDRFMSARRSSTLAVVEERETRTKPINIRASLDEGSGYGRRYKNMELK